MIRFDISLNAGSCHAWLEHGGVPQDSTGKCIVQECAHGLIRIRRSPVSHSTTPAENSLAQKQQPAQLQPALGTTTLAFRAPPLTRSGPLEAAELASITTALGLNPTDIVGHGWCVNGPEWRGLLLKSASHVLAVTPNQTLLGDKDVGIIGPRNSTTEEEDHFDFEVRAFCPLDSPFEDPATGSLNAGLAQWLLAEQRLVRGVGDTVGGGERRVVRVDEGYVVRQGTAVGRRGQIRVTVEKGVGGGGGGQNIHRGPGATTSASVGCSSASLSGASASSSGKDIHVRERVEPEQEEGEEDVVWIGGDCKTCISGMASFD